MMLIKHLTTHISVVCLKWHCLLSILVGTYLSPVHYLVWISTALPLRRKKNMEVQPLDNANRLQHIGITFNSMQPGRDFKVRRNQGCIRGTMGIKRPGIFRQKSIHCKWVLTGTLQKGRMSMTEQRDQHACKVGGAMCAHEKWSCSKDWERKEFRQVKWHCGQWREKQWPVDKRPGLSEQAVAITERKGGELLFSSGEKWEAKQAELKNLTSCWC